MTGGELTVIAKSSGDNRGRVESGLSLGIPWLQTNLCKLYPTYSSPSKIAFVSIVLLSAL